MKSNLQNTSRGFIALISILIVSVVLLATTLSLAQFGIASRYFILDLENKAGSEKLAEACVHIARIRVYNDPLYSVSTPEEIPVGSDTCEIVSVTHPSGNPSLIVTKGQVGDAITRLQVFVDNTDGDFTEWKELAI